MKDCIDIVISGPIGIGKSMIVDHICKWAEENEFCHDVSSEQVKLTNTYKERFIECHGKTIFIKEKRSIDW